MHRVLSSNKEVFALKTFEKICAAAETFCIGLASFLLVAVTLLTFLETVLRYGFHSSLKYTQELVTYSMPWIAFVGGAAAWRRGALVNIDVLGKAPRSVRVACTLLGEILILALLLFTVRSGIRYSSRNVAQLSPAMRVSMSWCYTSIPVGCAFMTLFSVEKILRCFRAVPAERKEDA